MTNLPPLEGHTPTYKDFVATGEDPVLRIEGNDGTDESMPDFAFGGTPGTDPEAEVQEYLDRVIDAVGKIRRES